MRYEGSLALQLEAEELDWRTSGKTRLEAIEGGGLDATRRAGVTQSFYGKVVAIVAIVIVLCAIGAVRVTLTAGTVAMLQGNEAISSQIKDLRTLNEDLQIERSLFSGSERIGRIATQNLGMVHASEVERLDMD